MCCARKDKRVVKCNLKKEKPLPSHSWAKDGGGRKRGQKVGAGL